MNQTTQACHVKKKTILQHAPFKGKLENCGIRDRQRIREANAVLNKYSSLMQIDQTEFVNNCKYQLQSLLVKKELFKNEMVKQQITKYFCIRRLHQKIRVSVEKYQSEPRLMNRVVKKYQPRQCAATMHSAAKDTRPQCTLMKVALRTQKLRNKPTYNQVLTKPKTELQMKLERWFLIGLKNGRKSMQRFNNWLNYKKSSEIRQSYSNRDSYSCSGLLILTSYSQLN